MISREREGKREREREREREKDRERETYELLEQLNCLNDNLARTQRSYADSGQVIIVDDQKVFSIADVGSDEPQPRADALAQS